METRLKQPDTPTVKCPACGGANDHDAVFCANPECHKALGDFRYVLEEIKAQTRWHERVADTVVRFIGKPHFIGVHIFWFTLWIAVNTGALAFAMRFDNYPFALLGIILTMETIFITAFVLISQNRQFTHADKRAELDYEVNVRTFRKIHDIEEMLLKMSERMDKLEQVKSTGPPSYSDNTAVSPTEQIP
jgi:uncharacterized membrane protein